MVMHSIKDPGSFVSTRMEEMDINFSLSVNDLL